jgi:hypothetical protein
LNSQTSASLRVTGYVNGAIVSWYIMHLPF